MGAINTSPRFGARENFRVATSGSEQFHRFYVAPFTTLREAGVANPMRPSGPDNRRFATTPGVSVVAIDDAGQMVPRADLPDAIRALHVHIETHLGVQSDGVVAKVGEPGFSDALIRFAKAEYGLTARTGFTD